MYLFFCAYKVCLKAKIRYNDCTFIRPENATPYFTFIPVGKLIMNYASYELCEVFRNASLA
jgi:hypothetical protein